MSQTATNYGVLYKNSLYTNIDLYIHKFCLKLLIELCARRKFRLNIITNRYIIIISVIV